MLENSLDNVKLALGLTDDTQDKLLTWIINNVEKGILSYLPLETAVPEKFDYIVEEVAIARFYRRGAEGMKSKSVEGFSVQYDDDFKKYERLFADYNELMTGQSKMTVGKGLWY